MSTGRRPNILIRLWLGFWQGLTAFRMAVFNILFLIILALVVRMVFFPADGIALKERTTLVFAPEGMIVEEYTGTPVERALNEALGQAEPETRLRDILDGLERAAGDEQITQVLIHTDNLWGAAPGVLQELAAAVAAFKETGKTVIAYGGWMGQGQYFLASLADEIWLDRGGLIFLEGYSRYRNYFREGLDKLAVEVNLFRVGEYKSAAETWIRDDMSEADREASAYFLGGLWKDYLEAVAMNRGIPVEVLADLIERVPEHFAEAGGDGAVMALDHGLVDRLVSRPEMRAELANRGAADESGGFRQVGLGEYLKLPRTPALVRDDLVGVIVAEGPIMVGSQPPGTIGADSTSRLIRQAVDDEQIKAVVLRINSGGGDAFAAEIIRRELVAAREAGKPVVVSMGNVAASGGYWIGLGADELWAYPGTLTGSIGIWGLIPTFQDTLAKIGVHTDGVGTTPLAGAFRGDRALPDEARELVDSVIQNGYREFIHLVAEHRQMNIDEVDAVARGRVWTGAQAQTRGLVDQLGTLEEAIVAAARIAGLRDDYRSVYVEPELKPWQRFLTRLGASALAAAGLEQPYGLSAWLSRAFRGRLEAEIRALLDASRAGRPSLVAHCLCEAPM